MLTLLRARRRAAAIVSLLATGFGALACSSTSAEHSPQTSPIDDAGTGADAAVHADPLDACVRFQTHLVDLGCIKIAPEPSRLRAYCASWLALEGVHIEAADFDACIQRSPDQCVDLGTLQWSCGFRGLHDEGAPCSDSAQCKSGRCQGAPFSSPGDRHAVCGTCAPVIEQGGTCTVGSPCAPGLACLTTGDRPVVCNKGSSPVTCESGTCRAFPRNPGCASDEGCLDGFRCVTPGKPCEPVPVVSGSELCGPHLASCGPDLRCNAMAQCVPSGPGTPCSYDGECSSTLVCDNHVCGKGLGENEHGCASPDRFCAQGLTCFKDTCATFALAKPGEPCDLHACALGECPAPPAAQVCPTPIADGAPCNASDFSQSCDALATCFEGKCQLVRSACFN